MDESRIGIFFLSPFQIIRIYLHGRFHYSGRSHSSPIIKILEVAMKMKGRRSLTIHKHARFHKQYLVI